MKYDEMTQTVKRRFGNFQRCAICGAMIGAEDDVQYTKIRTGRCMHYRFMHTNCLMRELKNVRVGVNG